MTDLASLVRQSNILAALGPMREWAEEHRHEPLRAYVKRAEAAIEAFCEDPPRISAPHFSCAWNEVVSIWRACVSEDRGELLTADDALVMRRAALARLPLEPIELSPDLSAHIGRMLAYAALHGHTELEARAHALTDALPDFFAQPASMDAATFAGTFNSCLELWSSCSGEEHGESWTAADFARLREAALALKRSIHCAGVH